MTRLTNAFRRAAAVTILVGSLAACGASSHPSASSTTVTTVVVESSTTTNPPSVSTTSAPVSPSTAGEPENLVATEQVKAGLLAAFAAAKGYPVSFFSGPDPGSTYYAYVPSTATYWAMAGFSLTSATYQAQIAMQDGASEGIFSRQTGQPWHVTFGDEPGLCPGDLPPNVMSVWSLSNSGACQILSAGQAESSRIRNTGQSLPPGTYFGLITWFALDLDGSGSLWFEPETWRQGGVPFARQSVAYILGFDATMSASYWSGNSRATSHKVTGVFDVAYGQLVKDSMAAFASEAYSGYVVTVITIPGCEGACDSPTDLVQLGPDAPLPSSPDFTEPAS